MGERDRLAGHAFISYVREDSPRVDKLQRALEAAGISVWRDTNDLWPGEDWRSKIRLAITGNALVFIACFSQSSVARERSYQNEELILAIDQLRQRRPNVPWLIPVRFDDCSIPDLDIGGGRMLASIQRADLFGERSDDGLARLVATIVRILGHQVPRERSRPELRPPRTSRIPPGREVVRMGHGGAVWAVVFSPDGIWLATASSDRTARVWDTATALELTRIEHHREVHSVAFSPDGHWLATRAAERTVQLWEAASGLQVARMDGEATGPVMLSPDGARLAAAGSDLIAHVWETATGRQLVGMRHEDGWVKAVAFSPEGTLLATAGSDGTARIWETASGRELLRMRHSAIVNSVAFSPSGSHLATGSFDTTARLWDAETGQELARMNHGADVGVIAFSPDGTRLATGGEDETARLWQIPTGQEMFRLQHRSAVTAVAFSPDGTRLATASRDFTARLWNT